MIRESDRQDADKANEKLDSLLHSCIDSSQAIMLIAELLPQIEPGKSIDSEVEDISRLLKRQADLLRKARKILHANGIPR